MPEKSYSKVLDVSANAESVYKAITRDVNKWWTIDSNEAVKVGDVLTVRFGQPNFMSMEIEKMVPGQLLIWKVVAANMFIEGGATDNDEWLGTNIRWKITQSSNGSEISLLHQGLVPSVDCYNTCKDGWDYFLGSLKDFLDTGKGHPYADYVSDRR